MRNLRNQRRAIDDEKRTKQRVFDGIAGGISKITETSRIPVLASVETVVAAIIGLVVFGQSLGLIKIIGIALVLASIAVMNKKSTKQ